jgi:glycosyltransferase involved in cell wall biosynthesis
LELTPVRDERVSVVIPARNEAGRIAATIHAVLREAKSCGVDLEVIVVDDGSTDTTSSDARRAGARVVRVEGAGNPGAARNCGAAAAQGDLLIFLDADCVPAPNWLAAFLAAHRAGERCVGGSLSLPAGLGATARCDYYFSSYHLHPGRHGGPVPNLSPANLSVRRALFEAAGRFTEELPVANGHEELAWQAALVGSGARCWFEPQARADHHNRPGITNLMRRTYRWAYSALQAKAESGAARLSWLYRWPWLVVALAPLTAPVQSVYIAMCWLRAGKIEPVLAFPLLLLARFVYAAGMTMGGWRWLTSRAGLALGVRG